jgi:hypothetical protein
MSGRNCARVITFGFQGVDAFVFDLPARPTAAYSAKSIVVREKMIFLDPAFFLLGQPAQHLFQEGSGINMTWYLYSGTAADPSNEG